MSKSEKINIENLTPEKAEALGEEAGRKVRKIVDKACAEANEILNEYGLQTRMQILIEPKTNQLRSK
jgi:F0F1-type ATP synthase membrane subunit b/b'